MVQPQAKESRSHQKLQTVMNRLPLEFLGGTIDSNPISVLQECPGLFHLRHVVTGAMETKTMESYLQLPTQPSATGSILWTCESACSHGSTNQQMLGEVEPRILQDSLFF